MDQRADVFVVDPPHRCHFGFAERRLGRGGGGVLDLARAAGAGDRAGNCVEHEDPAQRPLRHGDARGNQGAQLLDRSEARLVIDAG